MFDLLLNRIFGALYFSPKFLITCQIVILVRFQMIQTSIFGADSLILLVFEFFNNYHYLQSFSQVKI